MHCPRALAALDAESAAHRQAGRAPGSSAIGTQSRHPGALTCTVLPRPISSASRPLRWLLYRLTIHCSPTIWYSRRVAPPGGRSSLGWSITSSVLLQAVQAVQAGHAGSTVAVSSGPAVILQLCQAQLHREAAFLAALGPPLLTMHNSTNRQQYRSLAIIAQPAQPPNPTHHTTHLCASA
jgi:hypothetical protein